MTQISSFSQQSTSLQTIKLLFGPQTASASASTVTQDASSRIADIITTSNVAVSPAFRDVLLSFAVEAGRAVARSKVEGTFNYDPGVELYKEWGSWTADQKMEFSDWVSQQSREYASMYGAESAEYLQFTESLKTVWNEYDLSAAKSQYEVAVSQVKIYDKLLSDGYVEKAAFTRQDDGTFVLQRDENGNPVVERIAITAEQRAYYQEQKAPYEKIIADYPAKMEDLIAKFKFTYSAKGTYSGLRMSGEPMVKNVNGEYEWGQFRIYNAVTGRSSREMRAGGVFVEYDNNGKIIYERKFI